MLGLFSQLKGHRVFELNEARAKPEENGDAGPERSAAKLLWILMQIFP